MILILSALVSWFIAYDAQGTENPHKAAYFSVIGVYVNDQFAGFIFTTYGGRAVVVPPHKIDQRYLDVADDLIDLKRASRFEQFIPECSGD